VISAHFPIALTAEIYKSTGRITYKKYTTLHRLHIKHYYISQSITTKLYTDKWQYMTRKAS